MDSQVDPRKIIHLDLDCFYAAVEVRENPNLRGKPLGIGGPANSRSVLCTASYEARAYGVRAAMPSSQAVRLCPRLILLPPRMALYKEESQKVFRIFRDYTDLIEPLSLDEGYLDITAIAAKPGEATRLAQEIRERVWKERGLTISAGVAPNKFLAKVASDWRKPNGLFVIPPAKVDGFVRELPLEKIPGIGKVSILRFHEKGLRTCGDLQRFELWELKRQFGSRAFELYHLSRGQDRRPVEPRGERKSFTVEETLDRDVQTYEKARPWIQNLFNKWRTRFAHRQLEHLIDGIVVKIKYADFQSTTHEKKLRSFPTESQFEALFKQAWTRSDQGVRLLGLGVRLSSEKDRPPQLTIFSEENSENETEFQTTGQKIASELSS